jgi:hypothetical protein
MMPPALQDLREDTTLAASVWGVLDALQLAVAIVPNAPVLALSKTIVNAPELPLCSDPKKVITLRGSPGLAGESAGCTIVDPEATTLKDGVGKDELLPSRYAVRV